MRAKSCRGIIASLAMVLSGLTAQAEYPDHVIKIISPAPPGGMTDIMARLIQPGLQTGLGQNVIVEAHGGAGGYLGSDAVSKAPADGYTLLLGGAFSAITAILQKTPAYNPRTDLIPVAIFASVPNILVAGPNLKANTVAELIAQAKANPDKLNIGSNGVGTTLHLSGELFKLRSGTAITHVAYRGWAECVLGVLNGEVDMMFDNLSTALPNIKAGKIRALAVAADTRNRALPDVPTLAELGVKDAEVTSWFGIMAPAKTPQPVIDALSKAFAATAGQAEFQRLVNQQGMDVTYYGPAEAAKFWNGEIDKWESVIKSAGIVGQ